MLRTLENSTATTKWLSRWGLSTAFPENWTSLKNNWSICTIYFHRCQLCSLPHNQPEVETIIVWVIRELCESAAVLYQLEKSQYPNDSSRMSTTKIRTIHPGGLVLLKFFLRLLLISILLPLWSICCCEHSSWRQIHISVPSRNSLNMKQN